MEGFNCTRRASNALEMVGINSIDDYIDRVEDGYDFETELLKLRGCGLKTARGAVLALNRALCAKVARERVSPLEGLVGRRVSVCEWKRAIEHFPHDKVFVGSGIFIQFGCSYEVFDEGIGSFTTAIVKMDDGTVRNIKVEMIVFGET